MNVGEDRDSSVIILGELKVFSVSTSNTYVTGLLVVSLTAFHVNVGVLSLIVTKLAGEVSVGAPGAVVSIVNDRISP